MLQSLRKRACDVQWLCLPSPVAKLQTPMFGPLKHGTKLQAWCQLSTHDLSHMLLGDMKLYKFKPDNLFGCNDEYQLREQK